MSGFLADDYCGFSVTAELDLLVCVLPGISASRDKRPVTPCVLDRVQAVPASEQTLGTPLVFILRGNARGIPSLNMLTHVGFLPQMFGPLMGAAFGGWNFLGGTVLNDGFNFLQKQPFQIFCSRLFSDLNCSSGRSVSTVI